MNKLFSLFLIGSIAFANVGCNKECEDWHEGDDCVEMREKFYGTYTGTATSNGQSVNAQIGIAQGSGEVNSLNLLLEPGPSNIVLTDENGSFDIPLQNIYYQGYTMSIEGSGSFSGNQMVLNYVGSYQGTNSVVNFTGTK